ncbi:MAG: hypothetical protein ACYCV7_01355 [Acidimicrobiales bacterium]
MSRGIEFFGVRGDPLEVAFGMNKTAPLVSFIGAAHVTLHRKSGRSLGPRHTSRRESSTTMTGRWPSARWGSWWCGEGFRARDPGRMDDEGFVTMADRKVVDRKNDMAISAGETVMAAVVNDTPEKTPEETDAKDLIACCAERRAPSAERRAPSYGLSPVASHGRRAGDGGC